VVKIDESAAQRPSIVQTLSFESTFSSREIRVIRRITRTIGAEIEVADLVQASSIDVQPIPGIRTGTRIGLALAGALLLALTLITDDIHDLTIRVASTVIVGVEASRRAWRRRMAHRAGQVRVGLRRGAVISRFAVPRGVIQAAILILTGTRSLVDQLTGTRSTLDSRPQHFIGSRLAARSWRRKPIQRI
jgi:hypothetical protein